MESLKLIVCSFSRVHRNAFSGMFFQLFLLQHFLKPFRKFSLLMSNFVSLTRSQTQFPKLLFPVFLFSSLVSCTTATVIIVLDQVWFKGLYQHLEGNMIMHRLQNQIVLHVTKANKKPNKYHSLYTCTSERKSGSLVN